MVLKCGFECESDDVLLGEFSTISDCAIACRDKAGCKFVSYGTGDKAGQCYWEKTGDKNCPEGWQRDYFDFYEAQGKNFLFLHSFGI